MGSARKKGDDPLGIVAKNILRGDGPIPQPADEELWAYALNILDPDEEDRVMELIAASEPAQERLARIREAISTAKQMKGKITSVVAAIVRKAGGLVADFLQPRCRQIELEPVLLGEDIGEQVSAEKRALPRVQLETPEGVRLSVVDVKDRGTNIYVEMADKSVEGWVKLFRLVLLEGKQQQKDTGIQGYLKDGRAELVNCPDGTLRISGPGGLSVDLYVGP
jgi:hypothetical protein